MSTALEPADAANRRAMVRRAWVWLRAGISVAMLALLLVSVELDTLGHVLRRAHVPLLLLVVVLELGQRVFAAYRWYLLMQSAGSDVSFPTALRICFVSGFVGQFLPGMVGVEAVRIVAVSRSGGKVVDAFSSVIVDRFVALLALVLMVFISLRISDARFDATVSIAAWAALAALALTLVLLLRPQLHAPLRRVLPAAIGARIDRAAHGVAQSLAGYQQRRGALAAALVLAAVFQITRVASYLVAGWAVGLDAPIAHYFAFVPLVVFCGMLPISIGGIGVMQISAMLLFTQHGAGESDAIAMALIVLAATLISIVPGAYLYARYGTRQHRELPVSLDASA